MNVYRNLVFKSHLQYICVDFQQQQAGMMMGGNMGMPQQGMMAQPQGAGGMNMMGQQQGGQQGMYNNQMGNMYNAQQSQFQQVRKRFVPIKTLLHLHGLVSLLE